MSEEEKLDIVYLVAGKKSAFDGAVEEVVSKCLVDVKLNACPMTARYKMSDISIEPLGIEDKSCK